MAKTAFEKAYLKKKYGYSGEKYQELVSKIIKENHEKIATEVLARDERKFKKNLKEIQPKRDQKKIVLPDTSAVIRSSTTIIKAAQNGKLIADTLRENLRKKIKAVMIEEGITNRNGTVKKKLSAKVQQGITQVFKDYVKKNPGESMPTNIKTIAVTETKFVVSNIRNEYIKRINAQTSEDYKIVKTWVHNTSMSASPRHPHEKLNGKKVEMDKPFVWKNEDGIIIRANYPHEPGLPASEVINCHCDVSYDWVKKKKE